MNLKTKIVFGLKQRFLQSVKGKDRFEKLMSFLRRLKFLLRYGIRVFQGNKHVADYYAADIGNYFVPIMNQHFEDTSQLWLNVGYWKGVKTYADACKNLVHFVAMRAELGEGLDILDVGFGLGDQDFYWNAHFRPRSITGIDITPLHVKIAQSRTTELEMTDNVQFIVGSATRLEFADNTFDRVIAVDCAYHFDTREKFFQEAYRVLRPGGILVVSDMLQMPNEKSRNFFQQVGRRFIFIPEQNMYDKILYLQKLQKYGFENVDIESIAKYVFPGLLRYFFRRITNSRLKQEDVIADLTEEQFSQSKAGKIWGWLFGTSDYVIVKAIKASPEVVG